MQEGIAATGNGLVPSDREAGREPPVCLFCRPSLTRPQSGGAISEAEGAELEQDVKTYLSDNHSVEIDRLHIIAAYDNGGFACCVHPENQPRAVPESLKDRVMCAFGLAASGLGLLPCPILTDVRKAVLTGSIANQIAAAVEIKIK